MPEPSDCARSDQAGQGLQILRDLLTMSEQIAALPPSPRAIVARFDVPMGRTFRMWSTRGDFVVYVHRGWLMDGGRHVKRSEATDLYDLGLWGIPVHFEDSAALGDQREVGGE